MTTSSQAKPGRSTRPAQRASKSAIPRLLLPLVLGLLAVSPARATEEEVFFRVELARPVEQRVQVQMRLSSALPLELALPVWAPGSYRERHFLRELRPGPARTASGRPLRWVRSGRDRYRLEDAGGPFSAAPQRLQIDYQILASRFADDASHLDDQHAHLCGPSLFLLAPARRRAPHRLQVLPPAGWRVATPLDPVAGRPGHYRAADYDELVDAPLEAGRFSAAGVRVLGRRLEIVWHDTSGRPMPARLPEHVRRIAELHGRWFGTPPYPRYLLVVHTAPGLDYRGLEHARGASLVVPTSVLSQADDYDDLLYVIAHEHLHVWNGKRLRPAEHLPYDYSAAQPTRLLWWTEGVTDYLARRSLLGIGRWGQARYLAQLSHEITRVEVSPQRLWRSLADISFEAFWPHRDPGEPGLTYYSKGHVVALLLDLELRGRSQGRASLLGVLQRLLASGGTAGAVPLTRAGLERQLRRAAGVDLAPRLQAWVDRAGELDYAATLVLLGLRLSEQRLSPRPELGFTGELQGNELIIQGVERGGPAAKSGLTIGDRVTAIDGRRPTPGWHTQLADLGRHELRVLRRGKAREHFLDVRAAMPRAWRLERAAATPEVAAWRAAWLAP